MELHEYRCEVCGDTSWHPSPGAAETARSDHHRRVHLRAAGPVLLPRPDRPDLIDWLLSRPWLIVLLSLVVLYALGTRG